MSTCTECGSEIETKTKYAVGVHVAIFPENKIAWFWACEHFPMPEACIRLASKDCIESHCKKHPEHVDDIVGLIGTYSCKCDHRPAN